MPSTHPKPCEPRTDFARTAHSRPRLSAPGERQGHVQELHWAGASTSSRCPSGGPSVCVGMGVDLVQTSHSSRHTTRYDMKRPAGKGCIPSASTEVSPGRGGYTDTSTKPRHSRAATRTERVSLRTRLSPTNARARPTEPPGVPVPDRLSPSYTPMPPSNKTLS